MQPQQHKLTTIVPAPVALSLYYRVARPYVRAVLSPLRFLEYDLSMNRGKYVPPPDGIKIAIIRQHVRQTRSRVLIETGTYLGDTAKALQAHCTRLITMEIDQALHAIAKRRLRRYSNITSILGDCEALLPTILSGLSTEATFWLDAHYSAGITGMGRTSDPILTSLAQIAEHPHNNHTILIDDARHFDGVAGRPRLDAILSALYSINASYVVIVQNDIIVATPRPHVTK